ncbi:hypothetical protein [Ferrovibrio sp.]|uniref:hypothetical protein n=1 Tax=Ferrovibrio sp. TaxID=1917215 RepID=UPI001B4D4AF0|nr:hypothetical protein [Ferrovibrio sp.]MBP7064715.1 hypothetical protein [Ferrovibrio sp.]
MSGILQFKPKLGIALAAILLLLASCQQVPPDAGLAHDPPAKAQQVMFRDGVPHTDRLGRLRREYDPAASFFPIGIYHALHGEAYGQQHDLSSFKTAGYNTVHLWPVQDIDAALDAAEKLGLQVILQDPDEALAQRRKDSPAVLVWMLGDELSQYAVGDKLVPRLAEYEAKTARFKSFDPHRANLLVDGPGMRPEQYAIWPLWLHKADIQAQFNYPFIRRYDPVLDIERVGRIVARAVRLSGGTKPIWYISQAFTFPAVGWYLPSIEQLRATVFTALVHGASGIIHFSYDSHGTRDGGVIGISPAPQHDYHAVPDYDADGKPSVAASAAERAASQALWHQVAGLNRELAALAPSLLRPTAALNCKVTAEGPHRRALPLRLLAKQTERPDEVLLIVVNIEAVPLQARYECDAPIAALSPYLPDSSSAMQLAAPYTIQDHLPPFGVRLYRLRLQ